MSLSKLLSNYKYSERKETMKLEKVKVSGFKNIVKSEIIFNDIVALVSLNSFGKSNLLEAIDFGIDFINNPNKKKMMSFKSDIPLNRSNLYEDFNIEFEMSTIIQQKQFFVIYGYRFTWASRDNTGAKIIAEWLNIKADEKNQRYYQIINRDLKKALYRVSKTGRCDKRITIDDNELLINKLKLFDDYLYKEFIIRINNLNCYLDRHFDAGSAYGPDPFVRSDLEDLELDNSNNIPRIIYNLNKSYPEKYNLLLDAFMKIFPNVVDIDVKEVDIEPEIVGKIPDSVPLIFTNNVYILTIKDKNLIRPISFENLSEGIKRVFLLFTSILIADMKGLSIFEIEEPENSIHPSLLQSFLRIISQFVENCRMIVTSHSPYMIQYLQLSNIYIGLPTDNGLAKFNRIRESMQKKLYNEASNYNISTGDYIFQLMSGSEDDIEELKNYLEI